MKKFKLAPEIYCEEGSIKYLEEIEAKNVYIVTDEAMVKFGLINNVTDILNDRGIRYNVFSKVEPNPSVETVQACLKGYLQSENDAIIALGGGSPIDVSKALIYFLNEINKKKQEITKKPLFIVIPTTSGTGTEVTSYSVITDTVNNIKIPLKDDLMLPDIAILDCNFTKTVPPSVTADTGLDVLTHAVEACLSRYASDFSNVHSKLAIKTVFEHLPTAYKNGHNTESRQKMHNASCMAGIAFENASLGLTHSMAHILGARFHVSHGKANGVLLPYVIKYNSCIFGEKECIDLRSAHKYYRISKMLELPSTNMKDGVKMLIKSVQVLNETVGIPTTLKELGIDEKEFLIAITEMSKIAMKDICTQGNPVLPTEEDIEKVFKEAYYGIKYQ